MRAVLLLRPAEVLHVVHLFPALSEHFIVHGQMLSNKIGAWHGPLAGTGYVSCLISVAYAADSDRGKASP